MASKDFSNKLKDLRLRAGYSQKDVYDHFKIPQSTFSSWEIGKSEPSGEMLIKLCEFYKCDMVKEFSNDEDLNYKEWNIIETYRSLDDNGRKHIDYELNREVKRMEELQKQFDYIKELGLKLIPKRVINYYQKLASAGKGEYLFEGIPTDLINVADTEIAQEADFVLGVNGHSMEPTYQNGEKVFVKKMEEISTGEIGVFTKGNDCYIKELGPDRLISHNKDKNTYPDIPASEDIVLVGKVLGKVEE